MQLPDFSVSLILRHTPIKSPFIFERNVTLKMGQARVIHYMTMLFDKITKREIDPTEIITHRVPLDDASAAYQIFNDHEDEVIKVVLKP
jgi:S-(hydroxymethyl)glutathione dehydrogenase/alcohol dehydrogenase